VGTGAPPKSLMWPGMEAVSGVRGGRGIEGGTARSGRGRPVLGAILLAWCCALSGVGAAEFDETNANAIHTRARKCEGDSMWCSRCADTSALWEAGEGVDPAWITWPQIFGGTERDVPDGLTEKDGRPITKVNGQDFSSNMYHYFEIVVQGGDGQSARDVRRDGVYFSMVSPDHIPVKRGKVIPRNVDIGKMPAWDFFVGQDCVPQEGAWTNNG